MTYRNSITCILYKWCNWVCKSSSLEISRTKCNYCWFYQINMSLTNKWYNFYVAIILLIHFKLYIYLFCIYQTTEAIEQFPNEDCMIHLPMIAMITTDIGYDGTQRWDEFCNMNWNGKDKTCCMQLPPCLRQIKKMPIIAVAIVVGII